ncbi:hypothetical protein V6N11_063525 [Hibiscus sabdariffa]|uniref:Uncharacterized protein n=2 Tax=Hibiscus sabdariffa TaxID=183260 RepID=A0ABR2B8X3_9ROSI
MELEKKKTMVLEYFTNLFLQVACIPVVTMIQFSDSLIHLLMPCDRNRNRSFLLVVTTCGIVRKSYCLIAAAAATAAAHTIRQSNRRQFSHLFTAEE